MLNLAGVLIVTAMLGGATQDNKTAPYNPDAYDETGDTPTKNADVDTIKAPPVVVASGLTLRQHAVLDSARGYEAGGELVRALRLIEERSKDDSDKQAFAAHRQLLSDVMQRHSAYLRFRQAGKNAQARAVLDSLVIPDYEAGLHLYVASLKTQVPDRKVPAPIYATFAQIGKTALDILNILLYVIIGGGVVWLISVISGRRAPRPGAVIAVDDLTVADESLKIKESRRLSHEIGLEVRKLAQTKKISTVDRLEDLDGVAGLRPQISIMERVEEHITGDDIDFGPFKFAPKQIISVFRAVWNKPYESELKGFLRETDAAGVTTRLLFTEHISRKKTNGTSSSYGPWKHPADTREAAIKDFALQYVFDMADCPPTKNWQSFKEYCRGMDLLETGNGQECLDNARQAFEDAARADNTNWLARFKLAEVLRRQGNYEDAYDHFKAIAAAADKPPEKRSQSMNEVIRRDPHFKKIVEYNMAVSQSLSNDLTHIRGSLEHFDKLLATL